MVTDVRQRVLDAAESLFFNRGIAVTGMDDVARAAGVAIATLYKHGGSKDALLCAVLERRLDHWTQHWDAALERAETPSERVLAVFDAIATFRDEAGPTQWCSFLAAASERPAPDGPGSDPALELVRRDSRLLRTRLADQVARAGLDEPGLVDDLVLIYNGALSSLLRGDPADPVSRARALAALRLGAG